MSENYKKCCICGKVFEGYGNNPWPVRENGKCCDNCNLEVVVPVRISQLKTNEEKKMEETLLNCVEVQCLWNDGVCHCMCSTEKRDKLIPDKDSCYFFILD